MLSFLGLYSADEEQVKGLHLRSEVYYLANCFSELLQPIH